MKKQYAKPDIAFDDFAMAVSVASCEVEASFSKGVCGVELASGMTLFTGDEGFCTMIYKDGEFDGLCYHVPLDTHNVFGS